MSKAPIQKLVDTISEYFVWTVLLLAASTFIIWYFFLGTPLAESLIPTIAVLIVACPCALGLATPISIVVGSGKGAELGLIIKNAEVLEKIHRITTIAFDKTGTITMGYPEVQDFQIFANDTEKTLSLAASLESHSEHPLAKSIVQLATQKKITLIPIQHFQSIPGKGVTGEMEGKTYFFGSEGYMRTLKIKLNTLEKMLEKKRKEGFTMLFFSDQNSVLAIFFVQDRIKENSATAIERLHKRNISTLMMTGDHEQVAQSTAKKVNIDRVIAEISPEKKLQTIAELHETGAFVAMVGDGINDAPALAKADVGIAMGTGTDIAIESGDIVIVKGDLTKAIDALELSGATLRNIKQNLFWAFIYNLVALPIAAFGLLHPLISALAMASSSISVVLNALRLKRFKPSHASAMIAK